MAIKKAIYEVCARCGEIDARVEGDLVRYGLHDCQKAEPRGGPPVPKWGGTALLSSVIFVPGAAPIVRLPRDAQITVLLDIAERCSDIVEDVEAIAGWAESGPLLGIKAVASSQVNRIQNIVANMRADATPNT